MSEIEPYLEDNRPTLDEVCKEYKECTEKCPAWKFCKTESEDKMADIELVIKIPEEMLENEILDAVISVDTDNKIIKKVHIEPRVDDNKKVLDKMLVL
jgi:hypothetical protein